MTPFDQRFRGLQVARCFKIGLGLAVMARRGNARLAPPPGLPGSAQLAAFLGTWCAQGDPAKQASIAGSGPPATVAFLTLSNENGDSSPGNLRGANQIVAPAGSSSWAP